MKASSPITRTLATMPKEALWDILYHNLAHDGHRNVPYFYTIDLERVGTKKPRIIYTIFIQKDTVAAKAEALRGLKRYRHVELGNYSFIVV